MILEGETKKEIVFKVILLGDAAVGKTSILIRYIKNIFLINYKNTVGVEFSNKIIDIDENVCVKLQIWDTAGQEVFRSIIKNFYKSTSAVFLIYNITVKRSFENLKDWLLQFQENSDRKVITVLIGTQSDRQTQREVSKQQAQTFMNENSINLFFQTSAKTGDMIERAFQQTAKQLFLQRQTKIQAQNNIKNQNDFKIELNSENTKQKQCCL